MLSISLLSIFSGYQVSKFTKDNKFISLILILLCLFLPLYWNFLIARESTYNIVQEWINTNISAKTYFAVTERRSLSYVPSTSVSQTLRSFSPGYYETASDFIKDTFPDNVRNVIYLGEFKKTSKNTNLNEALKYFPVSYVVDTYLGSYDRLLNNSHISKLQLIAHFSPTGNIISDEKIPELFFDAPYVFPLFKLERPGPYFDIIKIK